MPMISTVTNIKISEKQEKVLKEKFGEAITTIPGKSESWLMLAFQGDCDMYFRGDRLTPMAYLNVKCFGSFGGDGVTKTLTEKLTAIVGDTLNISPDHIYISYTACSDWGWNGRNF